MKCLSVVMFLFVFSINVSGAVRYGVVDLGELAGGFNDPRAINNVGQIVGETGTYPNTQAFLWYEGVGTLLIPGSIRSLASDINDAGWIVGDQTTGTSIEGCLWRNGGLEYLGSLGGIMTYGVGINNLGQIVGESDYDPSQYWRGHAFVWQEGPMSDLGTFGGDQSRALAINNKGHVVGWSRLANRTPHAFLWEGEQVIDLGAGDDDWSDAWDINDAGVIVGFGNIGRNQNIACIWKDGTCTFLWELGEWSCARAINNRGQIVGYSEDISPTSRTHAFLYEDGEVFDLNNLIVSDLQVEMVHAEDINDRGQIVGFGKIDGDYRGMLLNPFVVGDFTGDYDVDIEDFGVFSKAWMSTPNDPNSWNPVCDLYDPNETPPYAGYVFDPNDVIIDVSDLEILSEHWLEGR